MRLPLLYYGDPLLRKKCESVGEITEEVRSLVRDMIETMDAEKGAGIAASQVGHLVRIFVLRNYVETAEGDWVLSAPVVYINPHFLEMSSEKVTDNEGCLSIPRIRLPVERPLRITIQATDLEGNSFTEVVEGYNARVRMHENDHLNGVLFIDRVNPQTRRSIEPRLREIKKKYNSSRP